MLIKTGMSASEKTLHVNRPFNLCIEESRNAYLLVWRVYASPERPSWSVKCVEWELQPCAITVIIKFRVACTLFIITRRGLISFTHTDWFGWWMWCVRRVGVDTVGPQPRSVEVFKDMFRVENSIPLFLFFYTRNEHVCLPQRVCNVTGYEKTYSSESQPPEQCQSIWAVNHECKLTPLLVLKLVLTCDEHWSVQVFEVLKWAISPSNLWTSDICSPQIHNAIDVCGVFPGRRLHPFPSFPLFLGLPTSIAVGIYCTHIHQQNASKA